jgi:hypothetical protein
MSKGDIDFGNPRILVRDGKGEGLGMREEVRIAGVPLSGGGRREHPCLRVWRTGTSVLQNPAVRVSVRADALLDPQEGAG